MVCDKQLDANLKHHYFNEKSYIMELAQLVSEIAGEKVKHHKVLTTGCSVGRLPFELGKVFGESLGIDYTTRYFELSTDLKHKGEYKHNEIEISLEKMGLCSKNVFFMQVNPENPDAKKINNFEWVVIDGFSIHQDRLGQALQQSLKLITPNAHILMMSVSKINDLPSEEGWAILAQSLEHGMVEVKETVQLKASLEDQSYLPTKEEGLTFTLTHYQITQE